MDFEKSKNYFGTKNYRLPDNLLDNFFNKLLIIFQNY